ncbi:uncharacterized protein CEXT_214101 [Caerostris extrusa]|uniref:Uncharacterized protein n=1 Tax=Caerostris extrusa TaxID=172846 RepID=A0AAV4Y846_CAEEX|nr:uncharacterized protein CEXT_214101 [Caerostris extrusa]
MKAVALSIFIAVVVVACVDCQEDELCGFLKIKCQPNQYCFKPKIPNVDLGVCFNYLGKGAVCNDDLRCDPKLECRRGITMLFRFKK